VSSKVFITGSGGVGHLTLHHCHISFKIKLQIERSDDGAAAAAVAIKRPFRRALNFVGIKL
jgi:hypothetical protein